MGTEEVCVAGAVLDAVDVLFPVAAFSTVAVVVPVTVLGTVVSLLIPLRRFIVDIINKQREKYIIIVSRHM